MKMFKTMKVFDCQKMPADVREAFWQVTEGAGNDCYVRWYWHNDIVDTWLKNNGAKNGEDILINHWW